MIDVNQDFLTCHKATLKAVNSVRATPKALWEDRDSAISSLETVPVSYW